MSSRPQRTDPSKTDPELLTRTSWVNAELAYRQVKRGRADGNTCALWLRLHLQRYLYSIGCFLQLHCGKVAFLGLLMLSLCCVGLKTGHLETSVDELWVEEGGRLERELDYVRQTIGEGRGTSYELLIQTPREGGPSLLSVDSVLLHYRTLLAATRIEVHVAGISWSFQNLCYAVDFPTTETIIDLILEKLMPCVIITPIDCFWEGARLLGPDYPIATGGISGMPELLTWENLDPQSILRQLEEGSTMVPVDAMKDVFHRAGITTAYQEKPCLNPKDPACPKSAPNSNASAPDVSAEFSKGCSGFASKYMAWEQDLILGGIKKNKSGHIVRVEAYQSILQLMAEQDLYHYYEDHQKVAGIDWSPAMARTVLETFQRKFSIVVNNFGNESNPDNLYGFSFTSLMDIMKDFSNISVTRVVLGYVLMFIYACVSLLRWNDAVSSQSGIGMAGVVLVSLSVAAGLGICSVLGISFNASTTQIIPFLALGLGVDDMFLIAHTYHENVDVVPSQEVTGEVLKRTGVTVLLTSLSNMMAFFTAAIIPIPALRAFTLQAGILVLFNLGSVLLVYPAIVSLDLVRRQDKRIDVLCCFQSAAGANDVIELQPQSLDDLEIRAQQRRDRNPVTSDPHREPSPPPPYTDNSQGGANGASGPGAQLPCYDTVTRACSNGSGTVTALAPNDGVFVKRFDSMQGTNCPSTTSSRQCLTPDSRRSCRDSCVQAQRECLTWTLTCLAAKVYAPFLQRTFVKVTVLISFLVFLIIGAWGTAQVKDGLDLTDIVPRHTAEFDFLQAQSEYFGFYSIQAVTKGDFDYAHNQQLLYQYHAAFNKVKKIIKRDDGSLPSFWLDLFRQWLADLQRSFDRDLASGLVTQDGWQGQASEETILAFKLLAQTGDSDDPVNKDQVTRIRLVNEHGHIHPPAFYNYLTAWVSNDAMAYSASMANLHPLPKYWLHDPNDYNFEIHKSQHLVFTQIPFYLSNLSSTEEVIDVITEIRSICDEFNDKGLPNFPLGDPFTFYEQYIHLRHYLMVSLVAVLTVTFAVLTVVLMNPWTAFLVVLVLSMILVELFGFMGLMGIKLSAVPAVILIMAVGIGVEFTIHLAVGFITAIGSRNRRMALALEHTFAPVVHGAISTFLGILMLVGTEFDFIVKYFFNVLGALVVIGLFNGLMLLPVLLSIIGPRGEVIPKDNGDSLPAPTPEPSPQLTSRRAHSHSSRSHQHHSHRGSSRRVYPRANSDVSLSTISEEPTQYSSHEIVVQPEVVVETTTSIPGGCGHDGAHHQQQLTHPPRSSVTEGGARSGGTGARGSGGSVATTTSTVYNTDDSSAPDSPPPRPPAHVTRVKATATVKVEVHTPIPGSMNQEHTYKSKRRKPREDKSPYNSSGSDSEQTARSRNRRRHQPETLVFTSVPSGCSSSTCSSHKQEVHASRETQTPSSRRSHTSSSSKALPSVAPSSTVSQSLHEPSQPTEVYEPHPLSPEPQWLDHPSPLHSQSFTGSHTPPNIQPSYPLYIHPTHAPPLPLCPPPPPVPQTPPLPLAVPPGAVYPQHQPPSTPAPRQQHRRYSGGRAWDGSISVLAPNTRRNRTRRARRHHQEENADGSSEQDVSNA